MTALHSTTDSDSTASDAAPATSRRSRRTVLGAVGAALTAALAGCSATATPDDNQGDRAAGTTPIDTTLRVEPDRAESRRFTLDGERWVSVAADLSDRSIDVKQDGPAVDVVVMTPGQFERFRDADSFAHLPDVSMPGVITGEVASTLDAGEYVLVVDNTAAGASRPDGSGVPAVVDLTVTTTRERARAGARPESR